jgi:hypothetical protein
LLIFFIEWSNHEQQNDKKQASAFSPPPPHETPLSKIILTTLLAFSLILTLALATVSCKEDGGGGSDSTTGGSGSIPGGNITGNIAAADNAAPSVTNFSYWYDGTPLSDEIPGSSVTVSGGKVNIKLGTPPNDEMVSFAEIIEDWLAGITANPSSAKIYEDGLDGLVFYSSDRQYALAYMKDFNNMALFWYVDKDVTVTGTHTGTTGSGETWTQKLNCSLKTGWNYVYGSMSGTTVNMTTGAAPSGYKWQVYNRDDFPR